MKKTIAIICILLCAAVAFAHTASFQIGFSLLGANAGTSIKLTDTVKLGVNASVAKVAEKDGFSWIYAQAVLALDTIRNEGNDLDLRFGASYMHTQGSDTYTTYNEETDTETTESETHMKFAGVTFGIQYTHWFGEKRSHGIFVGIDIPVGGYVSYYSYGSEIEHGPFIGPLTSMATLGVLLTSFRTGYAFRF